MRHTADVRAADSDSPTQKRVVSVDERLGYSHFECMMAMAGYPCVVPWNQHGTWHRRKWYYPKEVWPMRHAQPMACVSAFHRVDGSQSWYLMRYSKGAASLISFRGRGNEQHALNHWLHNHT